MDFVGALRAITGACMKSVDVLRDKGKSISEVMFDFYQCVVCSIRIGLSTFLTSPEVPGPNQLWVC